MGRQSQTKYYLSDFSSKTTIIRHHHPLNGRELELLSVAKITVVVRLPDGSAMKILRRWTDVDGIACTELAGDSELSLRGLREVGIVIALEVTRLARNSPDWHHLLYLCRFTGTLIADEHTVYDPDVSVDRLILGIRGQMSELELETSIEGMVSARWNKAARGELYA